MVMRSGFTLIELMIVVAIIAIIAAIAIPSLLRSRMSANETAAIAACRTYVGAQEVYRRTDWNHDGVFEYAQTLAGTNSLFETTSGLGDIQLIDENFARAEGFPGAATPKAGYVFMVQHRKFTGALLTNYVVNTHMTIGYGLSAVPGAYNGTGRNAFQVNEAGVTYQTDRGASAHLFDFSLSTGAAPWVPVE
jgi:prepilin-type N-terminal cleavage/methylation domain-containing protein